MWSFKREYPVVPFALELLIRGPLHLIIGVCASGMETLFVITAQSSPLNLNLSPSPETLLQASARIAAPTVIFLFFAYFQSRVARYAGVIGLEFLYAAATATSFPWDERRVRYTLQHGITSPERSLEAQKKFELARATAELLLQKKLADLH